MEPLLTNNDKTIRVLMFPWLAHGHISPYLELAKKLVKRNFIVHLCSTPANFLSIKNKIGEKYSHKIHLEDLNLPTSELQACYHTTNGLPPELMNTLKAAFKDSTPEFTRILESIMPDLLIYDFLQPWAPLVASSFEIPAVEFITSSSTMLAYMFHYYTDSVVDNYPFETIFYRDYESVYRDALLDTKEEVKINAWKGINRSSGMVLVKGFREIEDRYTVYLSALLNKKVVQVGPLVQDPSQDTSGLEVIEWLDKKGKQSTVFVSFGTEYFLKQKDLEEIAHGLDNSNANFIWVLRFPKGERNPLEEVLPEGFLARVGDRGLVLEDWAPQAKILGHESVGGFVSHCGVSSMMESMKFGVPIIAVPMHLDQPLNARLVEEIGVGMEVVKNKEGVLERDGLSEVIRRVVFEESGEVVRKKAVEMSATIAAKGDQEIDEVIEEFVTLIDQAKNKASIGFY